MAIGAVAASEVIALIGLAAATLTALIGAVWKIGSWVGSVTTAIAMLTEAVASIGREVKTSNGGPTIAEGVEAVVAKLNGGD